MVAMFVSGLLARLAYYKEIGEKAIMDATVRNIRSGVRQQIAENMIHGDVTRGQRFVAANPVTWLHQPPEGYVGEVTTDASRNLPGGSWFFDIEKRELGYIPKLDAHLTIEGGGKSLRWRAHGVRSSSGELEDLSLVPVTRYRWLDE